MEIKDTGKLMKETLYFFEAIYIYIYIDTHTHTQRKAQSID